jgi:hypothetical protein
MKTADGLHRDVGGFHGIGQTVFLMASKACSAFFDNI